jgi:hypothetical protein
MRAGGVSAVSAGLLFPRSPLLLVGVLLQAMSQIVQGVSQIVQRLFITLKARGIDTQTLARVVRFSLSDLDSATLDSLVVARESTLRLLGIHTRLCGNPG